MVKGIGIIWFAILWVITGYAQQRSKELPERIIAELLERYIENQEASLDYTDLQEQLEFYSKNKLNLNRANRAQLERLFFLEQADVNAILFHRARYGDFISVFELQAVEGLDDLKRYYLSYFVTVDGELLADQTRLMQMPFKGKHELYYLYDGELQQRQGYEAGRKDKGLNYYTGAPFRQVFRYRFAYNTRLYFGFTGEKDMGEPIMRNGIPLFDFNSIHFYYRPKKGFVKAIALGDYQANFGQGLVFGSGIAARKSAFVMSVKRSFMTLRPYRSLNENEFLRGAALIVSYKNIEFTPFVSAKYISTNFRDTIDEAAQEESIFSSIQVSGLHRTPTEIANRHNVFQTIAGGNLAYVKKDNRIGFTAVHAQYSRAFQPGDAPYQLYNQRGLSIQNMGIDFAWQVRNASVFGELGRSANNAYAITTGLMMPIDPKVDVLLLYRDFSPRYQASFANPFAENTDARNERGMYTGVAIKFSRKWVLNTYFDLYRSPWVRYLTDAPSNGNDFLTELQYLFSKTAFIYLRFRTETRWRNQAGNTNEVDYLSPQTRTQYRLHAQYKIDDRWSARSRAEVITFSDVLVKNQTGVLLFQDLTYAAPQKSWQLSGRITLFNVDDYDARIYANESDVLYQYSVPLFQNSGVRYYLLFRARIKRRIDIWLRASQTRYSNVQTISSGLETIHGNTLTEYRAQIRYTF